MGLVFLLLLRKVDDHSLGGEHKGSDAGSTDNGSADDFSGINDSRLEHVNLLAGLGVDTESLIGLMEELLGDEFSFKAGVVADGDDGGLEGLSDDVDTIVLVEVGALKVLDVPGGVEESGSSSDDDALFGGGFSGTDGVIDSVLEFVDFGFGNSADFEDGDSSGELGKSLLELVLVVAGSGGADGLADLVDSLLDGGLVAGSFNHDGVVLADDDLLSGSENLENG